MTLMCRIFNIKNLHMLRIVSLVVCLELFAFGMCVWPGCGFMERDCMNITFKPYTPTPLQTGHLNLGDSHIGVTSRYLTRDGKPFIGVMGEYHFARDSRDRWFNELAKMRAGGITIVSTYLFWIYHEEDEGQLDFTGDLDIRTFVETCQRQGLEVFLRLGPWAHGECRNGGFPDWLLKKNIPLRTNDPAYMELVRKWYAAIYAQIEGLLFKDGGPIIGIQLENELVDNAEHLLALKNLAKEVGFDVPLYTVTGWNSRYGAKIPVDDVLPVFGAYADAPWSSSPDALPPSPHYAFDPTRNDTAVGMDVMHDTDESGWRLPYERYPFATCEMGPGIMVTHHRRPIISPMDAYALSLVKLGCGNNLIGYYMYHGGTNKIGEHTTFNESKDSGYPNDYPILNYDFQTCLSEYGEARPQYGMLNMLHLFAQDFGGILAPMEHVPAEDFVPCTDDTRLRCCLRTDGERGFVFVNHHQRGMTLKSVYGAKISALGVDFPAIDVVGDTAFFFPINLPLGSVNLRYATVQPICRMGDAYIFAAIDGIAPRYHVEDEFGMRVIAPRPGLACSFAMGGARVYTLTPKQAAHLRRMNGRLYIGDGVNLIKLEKKTRAIEPGSFGFWRFDGFTFAVRGKIRPYNPCEYTITPVDGEPFTPPYLGELNIGGPRKRAWHKISVTTPEGFVTVDMQYDVAQIYADGQLVADNFFTGQPWRVPASLLHGRECYLVCSELKDDFYREA